MGASFVTDQRCRYGSEVFDTWGKTAATARDRWSSTGAINGWGRQERPLLVSTAASRSSPCSWTRLGWTCCWRRRREAAARVGASAATARARRRGRFVTRAEIIAWRRQFAIPGYKTLADVGFDGDWVTPYQITSNSQTGPVLVALHWLDATSARRYRDALTKGYLPGMRFNNVIDRALELAGLTRSNVYLTQAFHLLPDTRSESIPRRHIDASFNRITRYEVEGRTVIALGTDAVGACARAGVPHIECPHPSARGAGMTENYKAETLAAALGGRGGRRRAATVG